MFPLQSSPQVIQQFIEPQTLYLPEIAPPQIQDPSSWGPQFQPSLDFDATVPFDFESLEDDDNAQFVYPLLPTKPSWPEDLISHRAIEIWQRREKLWGHLRQSHDLYVDPSVISGQIKPSIPGWRQIGDPYVMPSRFVLDPLEHKRDSPIPRLSAIVDYLPASIHCNQTAKTCPNCDTSASCNTTIPTWKPQCPQCHSDWIYWVIRRFVILSLLCGVLQWWARQVVRRRQFMGPVYVSTVSFARLHLTVLTIYRCLFSGLYRRRGRESRKWRQGCLFRVAFSVGVMGNWSMGYWDMFL